MKKLRVTEGETDWTLLAYLYVGSVSNFRELFDLNPQALNRDPYDDEIINLPDGITTTTTTTNDDTLFNLDRVARAQTIEWF